jgi:hypothetical protein
VADAVEAGKTDEPGVAKTLERSEEGAATDVTSYGKRKFVLKKIDSFFLPHRPRQKNERMDDTTKAAARSVLQARLLRASVALTSQEMPQPTADEALMEMMADLVYFQWDSEVRKQTFMTWDEDKDRVDLPEQQYIQLATMVKIQHDWHEHAVWLFSSLVQIKVGDDTTRGDAIIKGLQEKVLEEMAQSGLVLMSP